MEYLKALHTKINLRPDLMILSFETSRDENIPESQ